MVGLNTGEWMLWPHYFFLDTGYVTLYINITYHMRTENIANTRHKRYQFIHFLCHGRLGKDRHCFFHLFFNLAKETPVPTEIICNNSILHYIFNLKYPSLLFTWLSWKCFEWNKILKTPRSISRSPIISAAAAQSIK